MDIEQMKQQKEAEKTASEKTTYPPPPNLPINRQPTTALI